MALTANLQALPHSWHNVFPEQTVKKVARTYDFTCAARTQRNTGDNGRGNGCVHNLLIDGWQSYYRWLKTLRHSLGAGDRKADGRERSR